MERTAYVEPPLDGGSGGRPVSGMAREAAERLTLGQTPGVRGDDLWSEAGRKVLRLQLARMLARVPGVITGEDPEEVHAMRVAARRMRAAWRVFGDAFEREPMRRHRRDLREVGAGLGAVRDLDVQLDILAAYAVRRGDRGRAGLGSLTRAWSAERQVRRVELVEMLQSDAFARFAAGSEVFGQPAGLNAVIAAPHTPARVRTRMPSVVWAAYDTVWAFDDVLAAADPTMLHQLRIVAKWLRYTLEFVREATEPEATPLIRAVEVVQDHLGTQHDLQVVATRAREFASGTGTLSAYERRSIERFTGHLDDAVERSARAWPSAWISLVVPAYRRRLGRALARL